MELNFDKMNGLVPAIIQDNYTQRRRKRKLPERGIYKGRL